MTKPAFSLCVYCGSRPGSSPEFAVMARDVGTWIGQHGGQLVYGGGRSGLMGIMADAALAAGAELLISGERDLLDLGAVAGVTIVTPARACTLLDAWVSN